MLEADCHGMLIGNMHLALFVSLALNIKDSFCCSEPHGMSYIETSNLDGETNLKIRQVLITINI